jgi:hypothetical protein
VAGWWGASGCADLVKQSLYIKAGLPMACQNPACKREFFRTYIRGDDDRYYCTEVCVQVWLEIDFEMVANG